MLAHAFNPSSRKEKQISMCLSTQLVLSRKFKESQNYTNKPCHKNPKGKEEKKKSLHRLILNITPVNAKTITII